MPGITLGKFLLATGGETRNTGRKLREFLELKVDPQRELFPPELPTAVQSQ